MSKAIEDIFDELPWPDLPTDVGGWETGYVRKTRVKADLYAAVAKSLPELKKADRDKVLQALAVLFGKTEGSE